MLIGPKSEICPPLGKSSNRAKGGGGISYGIPLMIQTIAEPYNEDYNFFATSQQSKFTNSVEFVCSTQTSQFSKWKKVDEKTKFVDENCRKKSPFAETLKYAILAHKSV